MRLVILESPNQVAEWSAKLIARRINDYKPNISKSFVLGLPSGTTSIPFYKELVNLYKKHEVSFACVTTFNMISFVGTSMNSPDGIHAFMWKHFFKYIDINPSNVHILDGCAQDLDMECNNFENTIKAVGPINLFVSDVSPEGFIGFNEPGSSLKSKTRVKTLAYKSRQYMKRTFEEFRSVPRTALTVGIGTVMEAQEVMFIATGNSKSDAICKAVEKGISHNNSISMFQQHPKVIITCDTDATMDLKMKTVQYYKEMQDILQLNYKEKGEVF